MTAAEKKALLEKLVLQVVAPGDGLAHAVVTYANEIVQQVERYHVVYDQAEAKGKSNA